MQNIKTKQQTRELGRPSDWEPTVPCATISVVDTVIPVGDKVSNGMVTLWKPDAVEQAQLLSGGYLRLTILGTSHPVIAIGTVSAFEVEVVP